MLRHIEEEIDELRAFANEYTTLKAHVANTTVQVTELSSCLNTVKRHVPDFDAAPLEHTVAQLRVTVAEARTRLTNYVERVKTKKRLCVQSLHKLYDLLRHFEDISCEDDGVDSFADLMRASD